MPKIMLIKLETIVAVAKNCDIVTFFHKNKLRGKKCQSFVFLTFFKRWKDTPLRIHVEFMSLL